MKPNSSPVSRISLVTALLFGALPFSAQASHSDDFTVWDAGGNVVEYVQISEADEVRNGPDFVYRLTTAGDPSQFGNYTTLFDDPHNPTTSIGDVFGVVEDGLDPNGVQLYVLAFSSDTENQLPYGGGGPGGVPGPGGNYWEEDLAAFDATMYLAFDLRALGWTAAFRSDNALNNIPEPASLSLLALGALGLLASRRRQKPAA